MPHKPNKLHFMSVKAYHMISLLNCLGKVCQKVVADMLAEWCEVNYIFHSG